MFIAVACDAVLHKEHDLLPGCSIFAEHKKRATTRFKGARSAAPLGTLLLKRRSAVVCLKDMNWTFPPNVHASCVGTTSKLFARESMLQERNGVESLSKSLRSSMRQ